MRNTTRTSRCFYSQLKYIVGNILARAAALLINLNIHDAPIDSRDLAVLPPLSIRSIPFAFPVFVFFRLTSVGASIGWRRKEGLQPMDLDLCSSVTPTYGPMLGVTQPQ